MAAGGSLSFFINNTTTPKNVYGDKALTINNGSVLTLDSAARVTVGDVWGSGDYKVILKDSAGATIWTKNDWIDAAPATQYALPNPASGTNGQVITTNGSVYGLSSLREVPDPTGMSGKQLGTDGSLIFWEAKQVIPVYTSTSLPGGITQGAGSFQIGKMLIQFGTGTAPTSGTIATSVAVTFATAYTSSLLHVGIEPSVAAVTSEGAQVSHAATGRSNSGFTANFFAGAENNGGSVNISTAVTFSWFAVGLMT